MPGVTHRSKTKTVRFPLDLLEDLEAEAERRGMTANEVIVQAVRDAVPEAPRQAPRGQASLDELFADSGQLGV